MVDSARAVAEYASFQAFINCYLREIDEGIWLSQSELRDKVPTIDASDFVGQALELRLIEQDTVLLLDIAYRSEVGRHQIAKGFCVQHGRVQQEGFWSLLLLLVKEIFSSRSQSNSSRLKRKQLELTHRLTDSLQNMTRYLEQRWKDDYEPAVDFCGAEQCLVFGHWLHPTPKSRQGILDWQHAIVAPEMQGKFQLHYFAVKRSLIEQKSVLDVSAEQAIADQLGTGFDVAVSDDEVLIPTHPLQAQWLLFKPNVKEWLMQGLMRNLGPLGPDYCATSSVRTVYSPQSDWMFKLSLPVKITNSLRQNRNHELRAGVTMASLLARLNFSARFPQFQIISDPAYLTVKTQDQSESGFEVILRENIFKRDAANNVVCLAALLQDPWHPEQAQSELKRLIIEQANREDRTPAAVSRDWFDHYWRCAIEPCIQLFDTHGIALEAHQQNSLLSLHDGYPAIYFYRDNQGFYLAENLRPSLCEAHPPLRECDELFYPREMILDRFGYYLVVNQLFAVIHRFGADGLLTEKELLDDVRARLRRLLPKLTGNGRGFVERLLTRPSLAAKANLLTRVDDIDELDAELEMAVYCQLSNPLVESSSNRQLGKAVEYA